MAIPDLSSRLSAKLASAVPAPAADPPAPAPGPAPAPALMPPALVIDTDADPVNWARMPKRAADRLRQLRRERGDAHLSWRALQDERRAQSEIVQAAERRLRELLGPDRDSEWFTPYAAGTPVERSHPDVVVSEKRRERAKLEIGRLDPIISERSREHAEIGRLVAACESYLHDKLSRIEMKLHDAEPPPKLARGESSVAAVMRLRQQVQELKSDRARIEAAPWHSGAAKERMRKQIELLAARGEPGIERLLAGPDGSVTWREVPVSEHLVAGRQMTIEGFPAPLPLLCWLGKDEIIRKLEGAIDAAADDQHALTLAERSEQLRDIGLALLEVERAEEHHLVEARAGGARLARRSDADVRTVLGLHDSMPPP